ncbi:MAG: NADH-quinone oxidoreductase subunit NuoE [Candidatus Eisenbacteria bacterium]|jgi:NADH:ubiquinone oxidoreductase subunit E|nr:NADH-quinone oxidoreductase subunit NuoE [Candidatus Eisenbacteria bacterium]
MQHEQRWYDETDRILTRNNNDPSALIAILQDAQRKLGYLPKAVLARIAEKLHVPLSRVYAVATFYKAFKLKPAGKHVVKVCLGTACHIKGGPQIMTAFENELKVKPEDVTPDGAFSFESVRCVGCCGLAPVIMVDENFHGKVTSKDVKQVLAHYR